jgi:hypothetical protein
MVFLGGVKKPPEIGISIRQNLTLFFRYNSAHLGALCGYSIRRKQLCDLEPPWQIIPSPKYFIFVRSYFLN